MKRRLLAAIFLVFLPGVAVGSPFHAEMPRRDGMGMMRHSMIRHHYFMMNGIPSQYGNLSNPLPATQENSAEGRKLYMANCASCHGEEGFGDGPAGKAMNPPPSDISSLAGMPIATDSYLFWTISDGGKELNTPMPPFKDTLSRDEIWKVIVFLRNGIK